MARDSSGPVKPRDLAQSVPMLVTRPVRNEVDAPRTRTPKLDAKTRPGARAMPDTSRLSREIQPMPDDIRDALGSRKLLAAYEERPAYQQNDYLAWIARARRPATRQKRLDQMLEELAHGGVYMGMRHTPSAGPIAEEV